MIVFHILLQIFHLPHLLYISNLNHDHHAKYSIVRPTHNGFSHYKFRI